MGGADTINVTPDPTVAVLVDGGTPIGKIPGQGDVLNLIAAAADTLTYLPGPEADAGQFLVGANLPVSFDQIEGLQVNGVEYLLPDALEPNDAIAEATDLGSEPAVTLRNLTVHLQTASSSNEDYFAIAAHQTGKLVVRALGTDVALDVQDATGAVIATGVAVTGGQRVVIPVVGLETYYVHVTSAVGGQTRYSLELQNFAAPVPTIIRLNPADDTGWSSLDYVTRTTTPRFLIQADLQGFAAGIPIDPAGGAGFDVELVATDDAGNEVVTNAARLGTSSLWTVTSNAVADRRGAHRGRAGAGHRRPIGPRDRRRPAVGTADADHRQHAAGGSGRTRSARGQRLGRLQRR